MKKIKKFLYTLNCVVHLSLPDNSESASANDLLAGKRYGHRRKSDGHRI